MSASNSATHYVALALMFCGQTRVQAVAAPVTVILTSPEAVSFGDSGSAMSLATLAEYELKVSVAVICGIGCCEA